MNKYSPVCKQIALSNECIEFIIGTLFGDGCLSKPAKNARLHFTHGESQLSYIKHKSEILKDINPNGVTKYMLYDKRYDKYYPSYKIVTYVNEQLTEIYKLFYPNKKKRITRKALNMLTPKSIAYWYMDDGGLDVRKPKKPGHLPQVNLYLNTYLSEEEHRLILEYFSKKYDINFRVNKNHNGYRLRICKTDAKKFIKVVKPYILPEFQYKIDMNRNNRDTLKKVMI